MGEVVMAAQHSLMSEMGLTEDEISRRKAWLELTDDDVLRLKQLNELAEAVIDDVLDDLYRHFLSFPEASSFFPTTAVAEEVKTLQRGYFLGLTEGAYDQDYVEQRLKVGLVHERIGLDVKWYLGAWSRYVRAFHRRILEAYGDDPEESAQMYFALKKLVFFDMGLTIDAYIRRREMALLAKQQEAMRELSTPVLQVRDRLLILPIIGGVNSHRARQLTEQLLTAIRDKRARVAVIDITGVAHVDSAVANHLLQSVEASRLMGATAIVTGLTAEVAQTLVTLGVDLSKLNTAGDLQGGIEQAERLLGCRVICDGQLDEEPT